MFDLGDQDEVRAFGDNLGEIFEAKRQLVDAHDALASAEVNGAKGISHQDAGGIFLGVVNRVLEIKDDGIGRVQRGIDEVLGFGAGKVEARAAQMVFG